jgi:hypothetical protein
MHVVRDLFPLYGFLPGGAAINWESREQMTVPLSSTEMEYVALLDAVHE